jgi:hypothetical protein
MSTYEHAVIKGSASLKLSEQYEIHSEKGEQI